mgnify:CR=1 FL=1
MKTAIKTILIAGVGVLSAIATAGDSDALIALDKAWGEAKNAEDIQGLVSDNLLSLDPSGVTGKAELIKAMGEAEPSDAPYIAGDYKVNFTDKQTAIMVHSAGSGKDAHWSMHVWKKVEGKWQVAATASIPAKP